MTPKEMFDNLTDKEKDVLRKLFLSEKTMLDEREVDCCIVELDDFKGMVHRVNTWHLGGDIVPTVKATQIYHLLFPEPKVGFTLKELGLGISERRELFTLVDDKRTFSSPVGIQVSKFLGDAELSLRLDEDNLVMFSKNRPEVTTCMGYLEDGYDDEYGLAHDTVCKLIEDKMDKS